MVKDRYFEAIIGVATILIASVFAFFVFTKTKGSLHSNEGYYLFAKFTDADGIDIGSQVKIAGYKVGEVEGIELDKNYLSVLKIKIFNNVKIPSDSSVSVATSGFIGAKYLMVLPGSNDETFENGASFEYTQSAINVESLIKKFAVK